jgi:hypothetical protein
MTTVLDLVMRYGLVHRVCPRAMGHGAELGYSLLASAHNLALRCEAVHNLAILCQSAELVSPLWARA